VADVYSVRFLGEAVTSGFGLLYTVPAGHVAVIRSISVVSLSSGTSDGQLQIGGLFVVYRANPIPAGGSAYWTGRQVANAGESIRTYTGGGPLHWTVSGYLLTTNV
jgi:hypothetical protein